MAKFNLQEHLKQVHSIRKAETSKKVDEAIKRLLKAYNSINFNSVSKEAGVAKATLYNNKEIRERIEALREQERGKVGLKKQLKREIKEESKEAIIESLKRRIKKLEADNKELRSQLKVAYGEIYKQM
ncbi:MULTISPECIES: DUF6262 family protein [Bacillaceae]|uniref:Transposase n=2 Tax=Cytobacillus TaxID=2675230 RepID=A0A2N0ZIF9_9BACI|nr:MULTISPECIES: DUF6262 family protein [Bacillaceae]MBN8202587.1 transposase [Bacillus sp. NTK034]OHX41410.1 transposase [Cytobacillus oceanisediminis]PKG29271.1 transposase [Cytobacillus horneckiae]